MSAPVPSSDTSAPLATARRSRARRGDGDLLHDELLRATETLIDEGGEAAVTVRAVANRVGVSSPAVYLHFPDKQALLDAVCLRTWAGLSAAMDAAAAGFDNPFESLRARGLAYVRFGLAHSEQYRVLLMRPHSDCTDPDCPVRIAGSQARAQLTRAVVDCVEQGVFRTDDPEFVTLGLWAAVHGVVALILSGALDGIAPETVEALGAACVEQAGLGAALRTRVPPYDQYGCPDTALLVYGLDAFATAADAVKGPSRT